MTEFSRFIALHELSPFVVSPGGGIEGAGTRLHDVLTSNWKQTYEAWQADRMAREHAADGDLTFSTSWYTDRRQFLSALTAANLADSPHIAGRAEGPLWAYEDRRLGVAVAPRPQGTPETSLARILFGSDAGEALRGDVYGDRIYGMGGDDVIEGASATIASKVGRETMRLVGIGTTMRSMVEQETIGCTAASMTTSCTEDPVRTRSMATTVSM